jgi:hypothetical protein
MPLGESHCLEREQEGAGRGAVALVVQDVSLATSATTRAPAGVFGPR